jgi:MFS family permease
VIALNSLMVNAARIIGPALAGLLLAAVSEAVCFALNALSFVAVIVAVSRMRWAREPGPQAWEGGFWAKWIEGYRFVAGFAPARAMLLLIAVLSWTISPYSSLMPVYAKDIYGSGPQTLGFLLAAAGAGALASMFYLASRVTIRGLGRVIAAAGVASGLALAAFAYLAVLPLALALMFVIGGGVILAAASVNTILQSIVPDNLRGRVAGFFMLAFLGMAPLGNLVAGALGSIIGVPTTFAVNGGLATVAALWFWRALPKWRALMRPTYRRLGIISGES